jgi:hypothetical protein
VEYAEKYVTAADQQRPDRKPGEHMVRRRNEIYDFFDAEYDAVLIWEEEDFFQKKKKI